MNLKCLKRYLHQRVIGYYGQAETWRGVVTDIRAVGNIFHIVLQDGREFPVSKDLSLTIVPMERRSEKKVYYDIAAVKAERRRGVGI